QAGLCLALLFGAGLFATSLRRLESLDLGVDVDRTIQMSFDLAPPRLVFDDDAADLPTADETRTIYERVRDVLARHPNIERATLAQGSPYKSGTGAGPWTAERTHDELWATRESAYRSTVGAGFFATVGARSLRGRDFSESDRMGSQPVAIINAPLARYLWPSKEALGECMWLDDEPACYRIVGVLGGVWKLNALERDKMAVYLSLGQVPDSVPDAVYIRPRGNAQQLLNDVRSIAQSVYPDLPAARATVLREIIEREFKPWRLGSSVFGAFAMVALVITAIGLYGAAAVATAFRLREIGIRMALGARRRDVIRVVLGEGVTSVALGLLAGAALAAVASRWLGGLLFETTPGDTVVLVQTAVILLIVSAMGVAVPTLRALRTNPANVLRAE
ncbi:MAG: FtsX-like permease family protein, partial [Vicinamibacteraceae bacterium]